MTGEFDPTKLAAARLMATNNFPYLASAIFAAPVVPAPGLDRLVIDRWWRIHADPAAVDAASIEQLGGELLHLTSHVLRDHATRADDVGFESEAELHHWVDAADAEIADDFPAELGRVSSGARPEDLGYGDGRLAEEYYRSGTVRETEAADCGSGAHGTPPPWEPPPPKRGEGGLSEDEQKLIRRNVAAEIARAADDEVSASLRQWAEGELVATVDWRAELGACLRRAVSSVSGAVDYSYSRPSRRSGAVHGVVLPALQRPTVEVAVVCDTSASVSEEMLGLAVAEVDGLLRATGTRTVRFLACDEAVHTTERVTQGREVALIGGGGTDMAIGIDAAMDQRPTPELLVVLTDGYTPWPAAAPRAEVVVGLLPAPDDGTIAPAEPPSWARTIPIGS